MNRFPPFAWRRPCVGTSWDGYDTHYTERYMGHPEENPEGYRLSSVMTHCESMKGRLMIVHGMNDENVHYRHSARLLASLREAGKECGVDYSSLLFPDERHYPRSPGNRLLLQQSIFDFFRESLAASTSSYSSSASAAADDSSSATAK